jgi:DNA-binding IclR family transcriptional regulator
VWLASRDDAERIATYTENLATMTPDEIRALSAQVRETAAETWPEMEPG